MLNKLKKSKSEGFTIIEVMIVLAIAGLILLIVFLAVPAVQRNARNTTKRSDVSKALGAAAEFISNSNGNIPASADVGTLTTSANMSNGTTLAAAIPTTLAAITAPNSSQIEIATGVVCNSGATPTTVAAPTAANFSSMVTASSTRSYVALYSVDAAGGNLTTQCSGS